MGLKKWGTWWHNRGEMKRNGGQWKKIGELCALPCTLCEEYEKYVILLPEIQRKNQRKLGQFLGINFLMFPISFVRILP